VTCFGIRVTIQQKVHESKYAEGEKKSQGHKNRALGGRGPGVRGKLLQRGRTFAISLLGIGNILFKGGASPTSRGRCDWKKTNHLSIMTVRRATGMPAHAMRRPLTGGRARHWERGVDVRRPEPLRHGWLGERRRTKKKPSQKTGVQDGDRGLLKRNRRIVHATQKSNLEETKQCGLLSPA